jgi:hypothetical protein
VFYTIKNLKGVKMTRKIDADLDVFDILASPVYPVFEKSLIDKILESHNYGQISTTPKQKKDTIRKKRVEILKPFEEEGFLIDLGNSYKKTPKLQEVQKVFKEMIEDRTLDIKNAARVLSDYIVRDDKDMLSFVTPMLHYDTPKEFIIDRLIRNVETFLRLVDELGLNKKNREKEICYEK